MLRTPFKFSPEAREKILHDVVWDIASDTSGGFDLDAESRADLIEKIVEEDILRQETAKVRGNTAGCHGTNRYGGPCMSRATDTVDGETYCWHHNPDVVKARNNRRGIT